MAEAISAAKLESKFFLDILIFIQAWLSSNIRRGGGQD